MKKCYQKQDDGSYKKLWLQDYEDFPEGFYATRDACDEAEKPKRGRPAMKKEGE